MTTPIRVLLVDDQALLRVGFRMIIGREPDMVVVGEAADGRAAIAAVAEHRPDIVLMDVRMPGMDGITATAAIVEARPEVRIIVLTTFDVDEYVVQGLRAGASGFLLKDTPAADLVTAVRTVHAGQAFLAPEATRHLLDVCVPVLPAPASTAPGLLDGLTEREVDVLRQLAHGCSNREIGDALFISEGTVKVHIGKILAKLGVRDRVQAVIVAYDAGLVRAAPA